MPQVTIYVPQDLAEALDRQRDRINVSQVCAHALRKEIGKLEAVAEPDIDTGNDSPPAAEPADEMQALIERLRLQKQRSLEHADEIERARKRAEGWIRKARYEQLKYFGEIEPPADEQRFYAGTFRLTQHEEVATSVWGRQRTRDGLSFSFPVYRRAWHQQVRDFWQQVKDQI